NERDVSDKPPLLRKGKRSTSKLERLYLARIRSLASVDDAVADTVAALEETGELDNTYLVFTSDNGYLLGEHRLTGKKLAYEESMRVPFLVRGPDVGTGTRTQVVSILDIAPTVLDWAGASAGRLLDGRSISSFIETPVTRSRFTRLVQSGRITGSYSGRWDYRGVREKRYTYMRWRSGFEELYDRKRDRYQLRNVAGRPEYGAVLRTMRKRFRILSPCAGVMECYRKFPKPPPIGS
ncbi:MAG: sulfatase-like hydrolase/transferase, partial [Nocardioides sp.]